MVMEHLGMMRVLVHFYFGTNSNMESILNGVWVRKGGLRTVRATDHIQFSETIHGLFFLITGVPKQQFRSVLQMVQENNCTNSYRQL
jgi:hypothetical protein